MMYDTIRLRQSNGPVERGVMKAYFKRVALVSDEIVTCTNYSKECLLRDVGIGRTPVTVANWPVDRELVGRVLTARKSSARRDVAIYVGRYKPHKNLNRLVAAFPDTEFGQGGGRLVLLGGSEEERKQMESALTPGQRELIEVRGQCGQHELEEHLANSLFLVQPSLEEGFGLPVWEAMSCGLPVCVSDGGALPEITMGRVEPFSATSTDEMSEAIDRCAASAREHSTEDLSLHSHEFGRTAPTVADFAEQFQAVLCRHL
jgi:glycosyltransferase involved in cell wall biosynthesis